MCCSVGHILIYNVASTLTASIILHYLKNLESYEYALALTSDPLHTAVGPHDVRLTFESNITYLQKVSKKKVIPIFSRNEICSSNGFLENLKSHQMFERISRFLKISTVEVTWIEPWTLR
jgi:hypothetical protein